MEKGVPTQNKEDTNKISSVETGLSLKDKSSITAKYESNKTSLLTYSSIDKGVG